MRSMLCLSMVGLMLLAGCGSRSSRMPVPRGKPVPPAQTGKDPRDVVEVKPDVRPVVVEVKAPVPVVFKEPGVRWETTVVGVGKTSENARTDALEEAQIALARYLNTALPDLNWAPGGKEIEQLQLTHLISDPKSKFTEKSRSYFEVQVGIKLSDKTIGMIKEQARRYIAEQRQHLAEIALMAAMALLAVVGGYLRLEEMTRGFYTGMLRLVAVAILALVGSGLLFLIRS